MTLAELERMLSDREMEALVGAGAHDRFWYRYVPLNHRQSNQMTSSKDKPAPRPSPQPVYRGPAQDGFNKSPPKGSPPPTPVKK
jgi:hypothetical protein